ncbi:MAG: hypothetical protein V4629_03160 [Pseudomonadota bacterium]
MFEFLKAPRVANDKTFKLPERGTVGAAGYDFYLPEYIQINRHATAKISSGVCWKTTKEAQEFGMFNFYGDLTIRSSMSTRLELLAGDIDMDYEYPNEIIIKIRNRTRDTVILKKGDRICQMIVTPFLINGDSVKNVRVGGFGSTGV